MSIEAAREREQFRTVGGTALSKIFVMGMSGLIGILTTRLIISHFGTDAYAQYGLLTSLRELLPFADLGVGAAVITVVAASSHLESDDGVRRTLLTAFRIVLVSALAVCSVAVGLTALGLWRPLLGQAMRPDGILPAMMVMIIFALTVPLGIGQSILIGMGRTTRQILTQTVVSPTMFLLVVLSISFSLPAGSWLAVYSYFANALAAALCLWQAFRWLRPHFRVIMYQVFHPSRFPGLPVMNMAGPMLIQMTILPLAMGTDRILLSHLAGTEEVVKYSLGAQLFGIILQTINAAGVALWPIFAKNRANFAVQAPWRMSALFAAVGILLSIGMCLVSSWLVAFVSDGNVELPWTLLLAFGAFVLVEATKYPLGMYMTDVEGLRFQVRPILVLVPMKIGLALLLIPSLGASGSVWSSVIAVAVCQVLVYAWWIRRDLDSRRRCSNRQRGRRAFRNE